MTGAACGDRDHPGILPRHYLTLVSTAVAIAVLPEGRAGQFVVSQDVIAIGVGGVQPLVSVFPKQA